MTDNRAFNVGLFWFGFAIVVMWFNPHHLMFAVAMISSSVWFAANWLAERLNSPDRNAKRQDVKQAWPRKG